MKKMLMLAATVLLTASAFAETTTTTATNTSSSSIGNLYQQLKESPLKLTMISENLMNRYGNTSKVRSTKNNLYNYLGYKLTDVDKVTWETVFKGNKPEHDTYAAKFNRMTFTYARSGILTTDKNGVDLGASLDMRFYMDTALRAASSADDPNMLSCVRGKVGVSRAFKNGVALSADLYRYQFQNKNPDLETAPTGQWYLATTQSYNFTDKFQIYLLEETILEDRKNGKQEGETMTVTTAAAYQFNSLLGAEVSIADDIAASHDGSLFRASFYNSKNTTYAVNLTATLF